MELTAQKVIDAALITAALKYYTADVAAVSGPKVMADLARLINEFGTISKTPLTYDDDNNLIIAGPDNTDPERVTSINEL